MIIPFSSGFGGKVAWILCTCLGAILNDISTEDSICLAYMLEPAYARKTSVPEKREPYPIVRFFLLRSLL